MQHPDRTHAQDPVTIASLRHFYENQSDVEFLMHSIGKLWLSGADIKWESLHPGRRPRRVSLPTYPFERQHYWTEAVPFRLRPWKHKRPFKRTPRFLAGFICRLGNAFCPRPLAFRKRPKTRKPGERGFSTPMIKVSPLK